jgi:hypothetical protein
VASDRRIANGVRGDHEQHRDGPRSRSTASSVRRTPSSRIRPTNRVSISQAAVFGYFNLVLFDARDIYDSVWNSKQADC